MRRALRAIFVMTAIVVCIAVPPIRRALLAAPARLLVATDAVEAGDVLVLSESGDPVEFQAGLIEAADLYQRGLFPRVMLVQGSPQAMDEELARRGVKLENPVVETLRQLGIAKDRILILTAGEGGTTESTQALATWVRAHPARMLVIIGATHSRRYRRALLRVWPSEAPRPGVTFPSRTLFRPETWWTERRTLRDGVFEFQKLVWDFATHPF